MRDAFYVTSHSRAMFVRFRYADKFPEAWWLPLDTFIRDAGGDPVALKTTEKKIEWAKTVAGVKKITYDNGAPGVVQNAYPDGRKKLNIGTRTGTRKRQELDMFVVFLWFL